MTRSEARQDPYRSRDADGRHGLCGTIGPGHEVQVTIHRRRCAGAPSSWWTTVQIRPPWASTSPFATEYLMALLKRLTRIRSRRSGSDSTGGSPSGASMRIRPSPITGANRSFTSTKKERGSTATAVGQRVGFSVCRDVPALVRVPHEYHYPSMLDHRPQDRQETHRE